MNSYAAHNRSGHYFSSSSSVLLSCTCTYHSRLLLYTYTHSHTYIFPVQVLYIIIQSSLGGIVSGYVCRGGCFYVSVVTPPPPFAMYVWPPPLLCVCAPPPLPPRLAMCVAAPSAHISCPILPVIQRKLTAMETVIVVLSFLPRWCCSMTLLPFTLALHRCIIQHAAVYNMTVLQAYVTI